MKRLDFIKSMVGVVGLCYIHPTDFKQYEKVYIKHCFLRGFQYYEGPRIFEQLNECGQLEMVREIDNPHDKHAIALYFEGLKIGYIPSISNKTLSVLMDTELLEFHAEVAKIESNVSDWEKIYVAIYALKEIKTKEDLSKIQPFTVLKTPDYYTFKSDNDRIVKIKNNFRYLENQQLENDAQFIDSLNDEQLETLALKIIDNNRKMAKMVAKSDKNIL